VRGAQAATVTTGESSWLGDSKESSPGRKRQAMRAGGHPRWRPPLYATGMAQPSDLEARVAASEARVGELAGEARAAREDAAAARHLAAANDRDVAEARRDIRDFRQATVGSFNVIRSDLTDLQTEMRTGFTQVRGQLDGAAAGIEQITSLLTR
jgi:hypothetical protein